MRLFNARIIDKHLEGDGATALADEAWGCLLVRAEALKFVCLIDEVTNLPTITVDLLGAAAADFNNTEDTKKQLLSAGPLSAAKTVSGVYSPADTTCPPLKYLRIQAALSGADATAHVRLWVCGRGPQLLETTAPTSSTFASQLAAARMCEDENRLLGKKRLLRPGASLFYPPEVFEPSLKWDR